MHQEEAVICIQGGGGNEKVVICVGFFCIYDLTAPHPTLGHCRGKNLSNILISAFLIVIST